MISTHVGFTIFEMEIGRSRIAVVKIVMPPKNSNWFASGCMFNVPYIGI